ncbi:lasso peptide biosynthesis B2 protein [Streptomyces albus]
MPPAFGGGGAFLCRLHGEWPDWCSGFRTRPFGAHAWLEVDGEPVGEAEAIGAFRTVIAVRAAGTERVPVAGGGADDGRG